MKNYFLVFVWIVSVWTVSCSGGNEIVKLNLGANISGNDINTDFTLNEIVDSIRYIQLENNEILGAKYPYLWKINDRGDYTFVDFGNNQALSIHDKNGKLLSSFNKIGKGEGEYLYPAAVIYDHDSEEVTVYDMMIKALYKYDKDGVFKYKKTMPAVIDMHPIGDGKYLCRSGMFNKLEDRETSNLLYIIDSTGAVCDQFLPIDTTTFDPMYYNSSVHRETNGYNFAIQRFSKNIFYNYDISKNKLTEICEFDLGDYNPDKKLLESDQNMTDNMDRYILALDPSKAGDYMFTASMYNNMRFCDIWSLKTGKLIARRVQDYVNGRYSAYNYQLPNGKILKLTLYPTFAHNGKLILGLMPSQLAEMGVEGIDPEGNLVMVELTLK